MSELTPITRKETFLAKAGGQNVVTPTPITREETFLQAIIDNGGGGGGTGGGVLVATMDSETFTLDHTWQEICDANFCVIMMDYGESGKDFYYIVSIEADNPEGHLVAAMNGGQYQLTFVAETADSYPVANQG